MNGKNFTRNTTFPLFYIILLFAICAQAQNSESWKKGKNNQASRLTGEPKYSKSDKMSLAAVEKWAAKRNLNPASAFIQAKPTEWLGNPAASFHTFSKSTRFKTAIATETKNKLKARRKDAFATHRKKSAGSNARITGGDKIILYVNQRATGNFDGQSWHNAYFRLSDALQYAATPSNNVDEIWVAWGTYTPFRQADDVTSYVGPQSEKAFVLLPGVKIYGGFAGGETSLEQRNLTATDNYGLTMPVAGSETATILSGDFNGNDGISGGIFNNTSENAYHVVISAGDVDGAVLDGVIIAGGNASGGSPLTVNGQTIDQTMGGGIALYNSNPTITNVVIRNNQALSGGAIFAKASPFVLTNALVVTNQSHQGGIYLDNSAPTITNATIAGNKGDAVDADGAGIYLTGGSSTPSIRNTILYGNTIGTNPNASLNSSAAQIFSYSIVQGSGGSGIANWQSAFGTDGLNNLDVNPQFSNVANGDFSVARLSPAVNAGNNVLFNDSEIPDLSTIETDVRGTPRIYNGTVDIGATENRIVRFVNQAAMGANDGSNWPSAYKELAKALQYASANTVDEIWVTWGTYKPRYLANDVNSTSSSNQDNAFVLVPDVRIYGGFRGNEISVKDRELRGTDSYDLIMPGGGGETATILSGDFLGDDGTEEGEGTFGKTAENAHHVVVSAGNVGTASLDGVIIAGGNATGSSTLTVNTQAVDRSAGGGIAFYSSAPKITNVVIRNNQATSGGALFATASAFVLTNALVVTNQSHSGGILLNDSAPVVTNATIAGNTGDDVGADGAGIRSQGNSLAEIRNTIVHGNTIGSNPNVSANGTFKPTFSYSIVQGSGVTWNTNFGVDGTHNMDLDPKFHHAETGSFGLKPTSPAIDAGNDVHFNAGQIPDLSGIPTDVRGTQRITKTTVDIGALESLYAILTSTLTPTAGRLYVKKDVTVSGNGSNWDNAVSELADALFAAAINPAITEIWVAGGIYHPLYRADDLSNADEMDRSNTFLLVSGVKIYGGFKGDETTLAGRDLSKIENASILSADLNEDDIPFFADGADEFSDDNVSHPVYSVGTTGAVLDGFTIQGANNLTGLLNDSGEADLEATSEISSRINESLIQNIMGSAITHYGQELKMSNLIVRENYGLTSAVTLTGGEAELTNSLIHSNLAIAYGGGVTSFGVNMKTINVTVTKNFLFPIIEDIPVMGIGVTFISGTSKVTNSIIHGNLTLAPWPDFHFEETGGDEAIISHSIIGGNSSTCGCAATGTDGGNNLDKDPMFTDDDNDDFSLLACSPAINLGTNTFYETGGSPDLSFVTTDLAGSPRIAQEFVDAGVFEFQSILPGLNGGEATHDFETQVPYIFEISTDCATKILTLTPSAPELGSVTARIWLDNEVQIFSGASFVQRHFDIEPEAGKEASTATVTLYFTQADFNNFNLLVDEDEYLPTGSDVDGGENERIANLRIYQFHGKASDNSGNPSKYPGSRSVITPSQVVWSGTYERWEVTFEVDGFSGFFAGTEAQSPLPVRLVSFGGKLNENNQVQLDWKVTEQVNISEYIVEYSGNAKNFSEIGRVAANTLENTAYTHIDKGTHVGQWAYYRLKIMEIDGTHAYSRLISLRLPAGENMVVYPVPAKNLVWIDWKSSAVNSGELLDLNGRIIKTITRSGTTQRIDISGLAQGVYFIKMNDGTAMKLVKE